MEAVYNPLTGQVLNRSLDAEEASNWKNAVKAAIKKPKRSAFISRYRKPSQSKNPLTAVKKLLKSSQENTVSSWKDILK